MNRFSRIAAAITLIASATVSLFAAGGAETAGSEKVTFYYVVQDRKANAPGDAEVLDFINTKFNVDYKRIDVPQDQVTAKTSLMIASGDNINALNVPLTGAVSYSLSNLIANNQALPLDGIIAKYGTNLTKEIPAFAWTLIRQGGDKIYATPEIGFKSKNFLFYRQDWLEKLGLSVPKTMDEFEKMMVAFRDLDPDGNGAKDTYAIADYVNPNGPTIWQSFDSSFMGSFIPTGTSAWEDKDGLLKPYWMHPNFKLYLQKLIDWNKQGLIHPDAFILKRDQWTELCAKGTIGAWATWYTLSNQNEIMKVNPNAKVSYMKYPVGPSGTSGAMSDGVVMSALAILKSTKPVVAERIIQILDWFQTPEGTNFQWYGIEGKHWVRQGNLIAPAPGIDPAKPAYKAQLYMNGNNAWKYFSESSLVSPPLTSITRQTAIRGDYPTIDAVDYLLPYDNSKLSVRDLLSDLDMKMPQQMMTAIVLGQKPITYVDDFIKEWLAKGGATLLNERTAQYRELRKKFTF